MSRHQRNSMRLSEQDRTRGDHFYLRRLVESHHGIVIASQRFETKVKKKGT
jgi:hypothetical protein